MVDNLICALRGQTVLPSQIIIVDSSAKREAFEDLKGSDVRIVPYPDEPFNYSKAINLGIAANQCEYTLVISSHMSIEDPALIERGMAISAQFGIEAMTWVGLPQEVNSESHVIIDRKSFNGKNGLSNSMSMVRTDLYIERPYREEVFSAEDQEWTSWYLKKMNGKILRLATPHFHYRNPFHSGDQFSELKVFNEELSLGHFVRRRFIYPDRILVRALRGVLALSRGRYARARMHFGFAWAMTKANFVRPVVRSSYF
ncbi:MAG: glycosyltransferase family 2 protein [Pseudomonadota bacterium]